VLTYILGIGSIPLKAAQNLLMGSMCPKGNRVWNAFLLSSLLISRELDKTVVM
jgi:hypothetical protein